MGHQLTENNAIRLRIQAKLREQGVMLNGAQPKPLESQGFMSKVFTLDSNEGKLILHLSDIQKEQKRQKTWEKINALGSLLEHFPEIPTAPVLCSGIGGKKYYVVQYMLPGKPAGMRILRDGLFYDLRHTWSKSIAEDIERIVARINQIPLRGYGWIVQKKDGVGGRYRTWQAFLEREFSLWTKEIARAEGNTTLTDKLKRYFVEVLPGLTLDRPSLVHGDITNPSNILISRGEVTGLVDWEWSLAGDPAWEFAFNSPYPLKTYFSTLAKEPSNEEKQEFRRRIGVYGHLYLTWAMYIHSKNKTFYDPLRRHLVSLDFFNLESTF